MTLAIRMGIPPRNASNRILSALLPVAAYTEATGLATAMESLSSPHPCSTLRAGDQSSRIRGIGAATTAAPFRPDFALRSRQLRISISPLRIDGPLAHSSLGGIETFGPDSARVTAVLLALTFRHQFARLVNHLSSPFKHGASLSLKWLLTPWSTEQSDVLYQRVEVLRVGEFWHTQSSSRQVQDAQLRSGGPGVA
jgi:hypothetical protein